MTRAQSSQPANPPVDNSVGAPDENPQDTMEQFIQAIADQDAVKLVWLYGGSYQDLINLFRETDPNDKQKLFEQYLKLIPKITLNIILDQSEGSKDEYKFVVNFKQEDRTLFQTRESDVITDKFTYTVTGVSGDFKILELPPLIKLSQTMHCVLIERGGREV